MHIFRKWSLLDGTLQMADAEAEAKDNFKYLQAIQHSYDTLYKGGPREVTAALPPILAAIHTMHSMARSAVYHVKYIMHANDAYA